MIMKLKYGFVLLLISVIAIAIELCSYGGNSENKEIVPTDSVNNEEPTIKVKELIAKGMS
ncbi:MAG: hypothetical protein JJE17_02450 [Peptostreptococcaceae bacterium]|nr:hypothetical protein [Peptostreptococcaceae bacterium]